MRLWVDVVESPVGAVEVGVVETGAVARVRFLRPEDRLDGEVGRRRCADAVYQLRQYFAGDRRYFEAAVHLEGTDFQRRVWDAVALIPWGETRSYGQVAEVVEDPGGAQAVGAAVGANPVPIIVPCHRVLGADGSLTGYSAGLAIKEWLLTHEGVLPPRLPFG